MLKRINFLSIPVDDDRRAIAFYRDVMGMAVQTDAASDGGMNWVFMEIPHAATKLHFAPRGSLAVASGTPSLALVCDDVDAEAERLRALGVHFVQDPVAAPWEPSVRWAMFNDCEDNLVLLQSSSAEGA